MISFIAVWEREMIQNPCGEIYLYTDIYVIYGSWTNRARIIVWFIALLYSRSSIQFLQPVQDMVGSVQGCWGFNVQIYLNIDLLQQSVCTVDQESFLIKKIIWIYAPRNNKLSYDAIMTIHFCSVIGISPSSHLNLFIYLTVLVKQLKYLFKHLL